MSKKLKKIIFIAMLVVMQLLSVGRQLAYASETDIEEVKHNIEDTISVSDNDPNMNDRNETKNAFGIIQLVLGLVLFVLGALFYFIPTIVNWHTEYKGIVLLLNIFIAWTILGWALLIIVPMLMEKGKTERNDMQNKQLEKLDAISKNTGNLGCEADDILKFKKLYDDGIITKEEYEAKKKQILKI